ncbi:MAG: hypothetical protein J6Z11_13710 [Candidatus Riflebacteria bacterium]|nr:hypothetical protein [Candidatus Riflebacteria bacterium]
MKKMKKIMAAAVAMMTFSTAAAVTGTVAWFTASNIVVADGIYLQADKEEGFVINNEGLVTADWGASIKASHDGKLSSEQAKFIPTSTADAINWYHANAEYQNNHEAAAGTVFTPLAVSEAAAGSGVYKAEISDGMNKNLYLLNSFYLKASTTAILNANGLWAKVSAESTESTSVSTALNNTLRVLVRYGTAEDTDNDGHADGAYTYAGQNIWAPFRTSETDAARTYTVGGTSGTSVTAIRGDTAAQLGNAAVAIPANNLTNKDVNTFQVQVFAYFEGEDVDCYSDNITATLDKVSVTVKLSTTSTIA